MFSAYKKTMKKRIKIGTIIYYTFIAFIGTITLLLIASVFPIAGNFKVLSVLSGSMEPAIRVGSLVIVRPSAEYKINDIITFPSPEDPNILVTHRIIGIQTIENRIFYITQGDANEEPDPDLIAKDDVIGKVLFTIPFLGYVVNFTQSRLGFILIIVVPATIIIYEEFRKIGKEIIKFKNQNKKKDESQDRAIKKNEEKDIEQDKEIKELKEKIEEIKQDI